MTFRLFVAIVCVLSLSCTPEPHLQSIKNDEGIEIREGASKVLFYQVKPKSLNGNFQRASYIHPLYNLDGNVITEDFPDDHPHHHGIYSAWHQIIVNGRKVGDGWTSDNISWEVVNARVEKEKNRIGIRSEVLWKSAQGQQDLFPIVKEDLTIQVHPLTSGHRPIDYNFKLTALVDSLEIGGSDDEKGYGGFSLRLKLPRDIRFIANESEVQPQVLSVDAGPWMNFSGSFDGDSSQTSGVVVFCHPGNPGKEEWILRKEKSMQNPAFPGRVPVPLSRTGLFFRYRIIIYKGALEENTIRKLYENYSNAR